MNEQKRNKMIYLQQHTNSLQNDWESLQTRLHSLAYAALAAHYVDIAHSIIRKIYVLKSNKASKKTYRAMLKFTEEMESQCQKLDIVKTR